MAELQGLTVSDNGGNSATAITVALPDGWQAGEVVCLALHLRNVDTFDDPSGWTTLTNETRGQNLRVKTLYRVMQAGDTDPTFSWTTSARCIAWSYRVAGGDPASPTDGLATQNGAATFEPVAPSISPANADTLLVCDWANLTDGGTMTVPEGMTELADRSVTAMTAATASEPLASSGATGSRTATVTLNNTAYVGTSIGWAAGAGGGEPATVAGAASLSGAGGLSGAASATAHGVAALVGTGTLTAGGQVTAHGTAALVGSADLSGAGQATAHASAALTGSGSLSAASVVMVRGSAALSGNGALGADGRITAQGAASLTGTGSLSASGVVGEPATVVVGAASLSGTGALTAAARLTVPAAAGLSGSGALATAGHVTALGSASLSGAGALSGLGLVTILASGALSGTGQLTALGTTGLRPHAVPPLTTALATSNQSRTRPATANRTRTDPATVNRSRTELT